VNSFEHGALRGREERVLAATIAHAVMDHRDTRAFSFLNAAALLELEQEELIVDGEARRRTARKKVLERAVRRLHALVNETRSASRTRD
jgi:hypothetical protein